MSDDEGPPQKADRGGGLEVASGVAQRDAGRGAVVAGAVVPSSVVLTPSFAAPSANVA